MNVLWDREPPEGPSIQLLQRGTYRHYTRWLVHREFWTSGKISVAGQHALNPVLSNRYTHVRKTTIQSLRIGCSNFLCSLVIDETPTTTRFRDNTVEEGRGLRERCNDVCILSTG